MKRRDPALWERGADLADGFTTVAPGTVSLPRGGAIGEAQSEREKRGSRHGDQCVASSSRRSGAGHATGSAQGGGPAPASKTVTGIGTGLRRLRRRGWSSYARTTTLSNQQNLSERNTGRRQMRTELGVNVRLEKAA